MCEDNKCINESKPGNLFSNMPIDCGGVPDSKWPIRERPISSAREMENVFIPQYKELIKKIDSKLNELFR